MNNLKQIRSTDKSDLINLMRFFESYGILSIDPKLKQSPMLFQDKVSDCLVSWNNGMSDSRYLTKV